MLANVSIASVQCDPTSERIQHAGRPSACGNETSGDHMPQIPSNTCIHGTTYSREEVLYDMQGVLGTLPPQAHAR